MLVIVPLKALHFAKQRLAKAIDPGQRIALTLAMANDVFSVLKKSNKIDRVLVCAGDDTGAELAKKFGFSVVRDNQSIAGDLNQVIQSALAQLSVKHVMVVHADLPCLQVENIETLVTALEQVDVVISPDVNEQGSNIVAWKTATGFSPVYGQSSFEHNQGIAEQQNLTLTVCKLPTVAIDVDTANDLSAVQVSHAFIGDHSRACMSELGMIKHNKKSGSISNKNYLSQCINGETLDDNELLRLESLPLSVELLDAAAAIRDSNFANVVTYSKKVFLPLTHLCRDVCHYCTFAKTPSQLAGPVYMPLDEVLAIAKQGAALGCKEALLTLGEKPELRYKAARTALAEMGFATTLEYVKHIASEILKQTNLLPHINAGNMTRDEIQALKQVSASMGIMLESASKRLCERGQPHFGSPDKHPDARLQTIRLAGEESVPLTTGILIGIGETRLERIESLLKIRALHQEFGHIQEIIIQNFRAKPNTKMAAASEPEVDDLLWTLAVARLIFGSQMSIQVPPNLNAGELPKLIRAGINDWGGVSPLTKDHVNPEAPWPHLSELELFTSAADKYLEERLTVYPAYIHAAKKWLAKSILPKVLALSDGAGLARADKWYAGVSEHIPTKALKASGRKELSITTPLQAVFDKVLAGKSLSHNEIVSLFEVRGNALSAVYQFANKLRQATCGDTVSYVVNRNINYTNICNYGCNFCAFSKGKAYPELRGKPYDLDTQEIARRVSEAWQCGATEVCMQGGIHPKYSGQKYLDLVRLVKQVAPDMHVHAFSPLEVWQGAKTLGISLAEFLTQLKNAGLNTLPGTAAEILDDSVRKVICPDKLNSAEWLEVMETAHAAGFKTTATIMFGHVDSYQHWATHLLAIRDLQMRTGGFTEFVPLPFVAAEAPIFKRGQSRQGPTFRESLLMHAVARIALHGHIDNIQASWVKMGREGAIACLNAGVNDLGGTLMDESITRSAGAKHGQEVTAKEMERLIAEAKRSPQQRTTLYGIPTEQQRKRANAEPPTLIAS